MIFDGWAGIVRVVIVGVLSYAALLAILRISGKRTLSKMNAFDLVITVALGSAFATTILSKSTALAEGIAALALLVMLQYVVASFAARSSRLQALVAAKPALLVHRGRYLEDTMLAERVTRSEILAAVRNIGKQAPDDCCSVVLEADGSLSVVVQANATGGDLPGVPGG